MNNRETTSGQERPQAGEWQEEVTQWGGVRRFRMIGGIKEYEMRITVDGGMEIPESQLEDYNRRKKERQETTAPKPVRKECPFSFTGMTHECRREKCAVFYGEACALSSLAAVGTLGTEGKRCPFNPYPCRKDCALYKSGCVIPAAMKERKEHNV